MIKSPQPPAVFARRDESVAGVLYALVAYGIWGLIPIYFKAVQHVAASEVLAHRVIWAMLLLLALMVLKRRGRQIIAELRNRRRLAFYSATALLVATNWLVFIWSIHNDRLLEASLGYYINPLISVVLGVLFLGEQLKRWQIAAVLLATVGVLNLVVSHGTFPWVALTLGFSFGFYGLLRKKAGIDAILGLSVETLLLTPLALLFLAALALQGSGAFGRIDLGTDVLLTFAGLATAVPLICFLEAARRLRLSTVGLMQYLAPSLNFLLAVLVYNEPFTVTHVITFTCIWIALAIYSFDAFFSRRAARTVSTVGVGK